MDLSQWHDFKPNLRIIPTNRKFYNKFVHKLCYDQVYGAASIPGSDTIVEVQRRILNNQRVHANVNQLLELFEVYKERDHNYRMRFERFTVSIFAEELDILFQLADQRLQSLKNNITSLTTVTSQAQQQALDHGQIILRRPIDCQYRVTIKDGYYRDYTERRALATYLRNLGDQIKISKNYLSEIEHGYKYLRGGYFYVQDPRIVDMIRLIIPNVIRKIQEVVVH